MAQYINQLNLGVARYYPPEPDVLPRTMNPMCFRFWNAAATAALSKGGSPRQMWSLALDTYVSACVEKGYFPFSVSHNQAVNDRVMYHMRSSKEQIVRFLNRTSLLELIHVRRVHRSFSLISGGYKIKVEANIEAEPNLQEVVQGVFRYSRKYKDYRTYINDNVVVGLINSGANLSQRWNFFYLVFGDELPTANTPVATDDEMELLLRQAWDSATKGHRTGRGMATSL